jgi:hypothetical protein
MKVNLQIYEKMVQKSPLHMKGFDRLSVFEKCFGFFKMDKKNVQILKAQIFYEKVVNCDDKKNLASGCKKNNFQFVTINFLFLFEQIMCVGNGSAIFGNVFHRKNRKK